MDRDTLQDDLDLILEQSRDDELPGEWDWVPPLGTGAPAANSAADPNETEEAGIEASEKASGPEDEAENEAQDDAEDEEEDDD